MKHLPIKSSYYQKVLNEFENYLKQLGYSKSTWKALPSCVRELFYRLEQQQIRSLSEITPEIILNHYQYLQQRPNRKAPGALSGYQVSYHLYGIRTFLNYQEQLGNLQENPISGLVFDKVQTKSRKIVSRKEVKQLYGACENLQDRAILALFYGCGLRKTEAIDLNLADIDLEKGLLYVRKGKGKKRRVVPLAAKVRQDLKNYTMYERLWQLTLSRKDQAAFMLSSRGARMRRHWDRLKVLVEKAGLPREISLHHLRHSIATHLLEEGLTVEQVRDFLGHSCLESTQIYTRVQVV